MGLLFLYGRIKQVKYTGNYKIKSGTSVMTKVNRIRVLGVA